MLVKSSFNYIKYLKLDGVKLNERGELLYIISVLKSAPRLVELVIQVNINTYASLLLSYCCILTVFL